MRVGPRSGLSEGPLLGQHRHRLPLKAKEGYETFFKNSFLMRTVYPVKRGGGKWNVCKLISLSDKQWHLPFISDLVPATVGNPGNPNPESDLQRHLWRRHFEIEIIFCTVFWVFFLIQSTGAIICQLENISPGRDAGSITAEWLAWGKTKPEWFIPFVQILVQLSQHCFGSNQEEWSSL